MSFRDRDDAAHKLVAALVQYRDQNPLVLAIPRRAMPMAKIIADKVVCLSVPEMFYAVGQFYQSFPPVSDEEVIALRGALSLPGRWFKIG